MTQYETSLGIDFGEVGYWSSKEPFRLRLDARPLEELILHSENAHRLYELLLIDRPGDVWDYVWVVLESVPHQVTARVANARERAKPRFGEAHPWPEQAVPFNEFDRLFYWAFDDTNPEDEAWLGHRGSPVMCAFADQLLAAARAAQSRLRWNDPLKEHVARIVRAGDHAFTYLDRPAAIKEGREHLPNEPVHTEPFYRQLGELMRDPEVASIAYRAAGDYRVLRMMATEQRRRADRTGHLSGHALHLATLVDNDISNETWDSRILMFSEGLAHGDLFVQGGGLGDNLKELVEVHHRVVSRCILSSQDEGPIAGFEVERGDGWFLYRNLAPVNRRVGLERIQSRRHDKLGPMLNFGASGSTVFEFDKTVVIVGKDAKSDVRSALAAVIAEWQQGIGDPLVVVLGDASPFDAAGCRDVHLPVDLLDAGDDALSAYLWDLIRQACPWVDVVVAVDAPDWSWDVLAKRAACQDDLWNPWIVATAGVGPLQPDLLLGPEAAREIEAAHRRARSMRPMAL